MHTFHRRPSLPQRGRHPQKRHDLRQRSLALVVDEEHGLPLYSRCYEGHVHDVVALGATLSDLIRHGFPHQAPARLTWVMEKGHVSFDNFTLLTKAQFSFLAAIPAAWVRSFAQAALRQCQPLTLPDGRRLKVYAQSETQLGDMRGKRLLRFRPTFSRKQVRTLDRLHKQAAQPLHALRDAIAQAAGRQRPRKEGAVRRAMSQR